MFNIPYEEIIKKIKKETNISDEDLEKKINDKLQQLSGLISKEGAAHIVANEMGVNLYEDLEKRRLKIEHLVEGMRNMELLVRVIKLYDLHEFEKEGRKGKVRNILVGDETGLLRIVFWGSQTETSNPLKEGDILKVKNGLVRENNGFKELHFNDKSNIQINPEGESLPIFSQSKDSIPKEGQRMKISDLKENISGEIFGVIVQVFEPRFYASCPNCFRKVELSDNVYKCNEHGEVQERITPVLNLIFDDGTDTTRVVCFRDQAEMLMGLNEEKIRSLKDNMTEFEDIKKSVLGKQIFVYGKTRMNDFFKRIEFIAQQVYEADPRELADELIKEISK